MSERHVTMRSYLDVLRVPRLRLPLLATVLGAFPLGILGLGLLLHAREVTGSLTAGGLAAAAFGLGNAVGLDVQGRLIDRLGQPPVLVVAGLGCALGGVVLVTAGPATNGPGLVVAASAGLGAACPATTGCMRVLLSELPPEGGTRTAGYALLAVLFQLALLGGPLLVSLTLLFAGPDGAVLGGALLAAGAALLFARSSASRAWRPGPGPAGARGTRGGAGLTVLLALAAGAGFSAGMVAVAVPAAALALGTAAHSGLLTAAASAGEILAGLALGALTWRWSPSRLLLATLAGSALALGVAAWAAGGLGTLCAALFLVGACSGPSAIASSALLDTLAPRSALTRAYTRLVGVGLLGAAAGNAAGGAVAESLGHRPALALNAGWLALLALAGTLLRRRLRLRERCR
ncbi:MFS transporter [Streptomyces sp. 3MP-14]|uniref:MFS transporter n=1 Tax=Streptomyces mimosae TaxID=2586635 RepID=A0A5N6A4A0_9ACTN|nr:MULTISPECIES: MFS transporter [Streptomyces]KAB8162833.1 MFS transporter [Streptomyces mimosae]KAB8179046.1 MFS transporter [Streptomyces sp. 3MP-14]